MREIPPVPNAGNTFTITSSALGATPTVPRLLRAAAMMPETCVPWAPGGVLYSSPGTNDVLSAVFRFGAARCSWTGYRHRAPRPARRVQSSRGPMLRAREWLAMPAEARTADRRRPEWAGAPHNAATIADTLPRRRRTHRRGARRRRNRGDDRAPVRERGHVTLRVVIVDDEAVARSCLRRLLASHADVTIAAE